ncbi:MAG TPA: hypothetical protein VFN49_03300 [Candidatus Aquilonibacter sp.]|nr:hypothetical protein [Candidatus Aquilonibacter sp.]
MGEHVRAGAPLGGIKGSMPQDDEGVLTPGSIKGAGGDMAGANKGNASGREDPQQEPHVTTRAEISKNDVAPEE